MFDIVGIDESVVDHIISIDRLPGRDEDIEMHGQSWQGGGKIATALAAASRLGASCGLMGINGDDTNADFIVEDMRRHGVDVSHFIQEKGKTGDYCISLAEREGGRSFIADFGNHRAYTKEDLDYDYISKARCIHMFRFDEAELAMAEYAKEHGIPAGFDGDEYSRIIMKHMHLIDTFIGSEFFYREWTGEQGTREDNCRKMKELGPRIVIFTFGSDGCVGVDETGTYFEIPCFPVKAIDTTGAGDVFHGAFLYFHYCRGMQGKDAARYASAVSAIKCTRLGGRAGIPTLPMVEEYLQNGTFDDHELAEREKRYSKFLFG